MEAVNNLMRYCLAAALLITCTLTLSCAPVTFRNSQSELMVFAAMSLKKPMTEVAQLYEKQHPGVKVNLNFAGSSSLVTQVLTGAPADVFASASNWDMDSLVQRGLVEQDTYRVFASNSIVLISPSGRADKLDGFKDLISSGVKRIAVGNVKLTPAGVYAEQVLDYFGIRAQLKDRMVYCDTVAQICDYTERGEVDGGIVFLTDYLSRRDQLRLEETAPAASHKPVEYPVAVIKGSHNKLQARQFIDMLCSKQGAELLATHGFGQLMEAGR
jgi:molybdate transport system substrate-binding protein